MSKTLCKGIRKDGSACRGNALDQYGGYCIAHGPTPEQAYEWRSLGGKNSATAARLDQRIPERFKYLLDILTTGLQQVMDGTLSPARYAAICRGVKMILDLYRQADQEMEFIRVEEFQTAAAQVVGELGNFEILNKAEEIGAQHDQHRVDSLIAQGLAERKKEAWNKPEQVVLTAEGLDRFDHRTKSDYTQEDIDEWTEMEEEFQHSEERRQYIESGAKKVRDELEEALEDLEHGPSPIPPPLDPVTGRYMTRIPAGVITGYDPDPDPKDVVFCPQTLSAQIRQVDSFLSELNAIPINEEGLTPLEDSRTAIEKPSAGFPAVGSSAVISPQTQIEIDVLRDLEEFRARERALREERNGRNGRSG